MSLRPMLPRRHLLALTAALAAKPALAQSTWKPGRLIEIVVGTNPGTGFDRTARVLQSAWKEGGLITTSVTVLNKPGGAGVIAYHYAEQRARVADELVIIAPLLLTNFITRTNTFDPHDVTPLCVLLGEEIVAATSSTSPLRNGRDFADAIKRDPSAVSVALSGIGGQNHVTLGLIGRAVGAEISKLKVVGFDGSGEAVTAAVGGHVDAVIGPASSVAGLIQGGRMRGLGVASEKRLDGALASVPTWQEQGIPVVLSNWRGVAGPKGMLPVQVAYWDGIFGKTVQLPVWKEDLARSGLNDHYLDSAATRMFLDAETAKLTPVLKELGFAS